MAYRTLLMVPIFAALLSGPVETVRAGDLPSEPGLRHTSPEGSIEEMGKELTRLLAERLYEFLQSELNRLKKGAMESDEALREKIKQYEADVERNPDDAKSRFILGQIYDEAGDGASAIIQTKMAEELYAIEKNMKGVAKCRRDLRTYYKAYGFKPGDFILIR